ncbi:MAG: DUF1800 domain-containing protein, partial [Candidatus Binatia bacterium]
MTQSLLRTTLGLLLAAGVTACSEIAGIHPTLNPAEEALSSPSPDISVSKSPLTEEQRILHVLNRFGYGPRPGDVERVKRMGLISYLRQQLSPETIPDPYVERQLKDLPTLAMTTSQLLQEFPDPNPKISQPTPPEKRPVRILVELQEAKLIRAISSERQLPEVMVDFWFNHFNVFWGKDAARWMVTSFERDAIRPHALGKFRDLLMATARHPAMLFYLDNWMSVRSDMPTGRGGQGPRGLNENYARELLELHTLGVDGGYTQKDVIEVARCFTGWTIDQPKKVGSFIFRPFAHDNGEKLVLGHRIAAGGGQQDGERVIDILAHHPSTARFIATKLVRRFVADDPPLSLVQRVAETFKQTDGDIKSLLVTIINSPEFFAIENYRAKTKTPFEFVASAVRAPNGTTDGSPPLVAAVGKMGAPLYSAPAPNGYPDVAEPWLNSGALLSRVNFVSSLMRNQLPGTRVDLRPLIEGANRRDPAQILDRLLTGLLHNQAGPGGQEILLQQLSKPGTVQ